MFKKILKKIRNKFFGVVELSYSRIQTYLNCPYMYKLIYEDGWKVTPNPGISFGLTLHRALERFHMQKDDSWDMLLESYQDKWVNSGFKNPGQAMDYYQKGLRILQTYHESYQARRAQIVFLEKDFRMKLKGNNVLRGTIDRIDFHPDGTYEIIEYKTHPEPWNKNRIDTDIQMTIYGIAARECLGMSPVNLGYYFLCCDEIINTQRTTEQNRYTIKLVSKVASFIRAKNFKPNIRYCHKCDFRNRCVCRSKELGAGPLSGTGAALK